MANAIPVRVPGTGGSTLEYVLPANMMQFVQSVNAVIDNSGGADTKPILTVLDSSSEVIADVEQGRSIPAGDTGRATWALRLADEGAGIEGVGVEKNNVLVGVEPNVDFLDTSSVAWTIADQPASKRVRISATAAAAGDYTFVQELAPDFATGTHFRFTAVPQDARQLVFFANIGGGLPYIIVNGDTGANYSWIEETSEDVAGVVQNLVASHKNQGTGIALTALSTDDGSIGQAVVTIPYYNRVAVGSESGVQIQRSLEVELWIHWKHLGGPEIYRHVKIAGWWNDPNPIIHSGTSYPHPISQVWFEAGSGLAGRVSLYKVR